MGEAVKGDFKNLGSHYLFWRALLHWFPRTDKPYGREGSFDQRKVMHRGDNGDPLVEEQLDEIDHLELTSDVEVLHWFIEQQ